MMPQVDMSSHLFFSHSLSPEIRHSNQHRRSLAKSRASSVLIQASRCHSRIHRIFIIVDYQSKYCIQLVELL